MTLSLRGRVGLVRLRMSRALGWLSGLALALPAVLAAVELAFDPWTRNTWVQIWERSLLGGLGMSLVLAVVAARLAAQRRTSTGTLAVDGSDIVMGNLTGARREPLASVVSGVVVPHVLGARVELDLASGDRLFAELGDVAEAEQALRQLGLDPSKRRCIIPLVPRAARLQSRIGWIVAAMVVCSVATGITAVERPLTTLDAAASLVVTTLAVTLAAWLTRERTVSIGADGVLWQTHFGTRFLRSGEIRTVKSAHRQVSFELEREELTLTVGKGIFDETAATIALRVEAAIGGRLEHPQAQAALALIARGGRSLRDWRAALARVVQRAQDYRGVALSTDDLMAIVESPAVPQEHRIGAALALAELGREDHKERVRIAADACANEPMRVALTKLADGDVDEAAVEEALAEAEAAPRVGEAAD